MYSTTIHNSRPKPCGVGRDVRGGLWSFVVESHPHVVVSQEEFVFCPDGDSATFEPLIPDRQIHGFVAFELLPTLVGVLCGEYPLARCFGLFHCAYWLTGVGTRFLVSFGSSSCSQIATRLPARTSFGRYESRA